MSGRPYLSPRTSPVLAALTVTALLGGCGATTVRADGPEISGEDRVRCARLLEALPERVAEQTPREVNGSGYVAAWGDPAIVLRCGVPEPAAFDRAAPCLTTNGIDWYVPPEQIDDIEADVTMTLVKRRPHIEVRVPAHYRIHGPSEAMVDLEAAIREATEVTGHCV